MSILKKEKSVKLASEPAVAYKNSLSLAKVLDLEQNILNEYPLSLSHISKKGINKKTALRLQSFLGITIKELSVLLDISYRTMQRKEDYDVFGLSASERILELSELIIIGIDVLGSKDNLKKWLHSSIISLGNVTPLSLMDNTFGIRMVIDVLHRLEHGIY